MTNLDTVHVFTGVIAEDNGIVRGNAAIRSAKPTRLVFVPGSVRFYPNQSLLGHLIDGENYLFSNTGINIGNVNPGWAGQGVLVTDFRVLSN